MSKGKWFSAFEMEEEQNATVHRLVLEVSPVKQSINTPDVKYFIGKHLRWQGNLETSVYFRQTKLIFSYDSTL